MGHRLSLGFLLVVTGLLSGFACQRTQPETTERAERLLAVTDLVEQSMSTAFELLDSEIGRAWWESDAEEVGGATQLGVDSSPAEREFLDAGAQAVAEELGPSFSLPQLSSEELTHAVLGAYLTFVSGDQSLSLGPKNTPVVAALEEPNMYRVDFPPSSWAYMDSMIWRVTFDEHNQPTEAELVEIDKGAIAPVQ